MNNHLPSNNCPLLMRDTTRKQKFLIKDKTELNHNKHELSLICYSHFYIIMIIPYHEQRLTRTPQCFRKTKIPSSGSSLVLFWQSKRKSNHFRTWWKTTINNLSVILNHIKAIVASHADVLWQFESHVIEWQFQWKKEISANTLWTGVSLLHGF